MIPAVQTPSILEEVVDTPLIFTRSWSLNPWVVAATNSHCPLPAGYISTPLTVLEATLT